MFHHSQNGLNGNDAEDQLKPRVDHHDAGPLKPASLKTNQLLRTGALKACFNTPWRYQDQI